MNGASRDPRSGAEAQIEGTPTTAFGKYQLFASLGRGGMADVFLSVARGQMGFNKLAVIKRLRQALAEEAAFRNMFLDEARLAARLNHPNIVHTYEVGEQNGVYFIAMEYLEGQSLNKVLKEALRRKEVLEPEVCARVVADALAGLGHAHELRDYDGRPLTVIHRDVSPHNIFVTYDGHTKLVDFGIAKAALSSTETEVGVLKGKVAYMSPEQAMGGRIDCRSDLFAMGIVLWELLARQRLMTGESAANTLHKLMNEPIPRLSQFVPQIDPQLDGIVARALEKDPANRFQSAQEMRDALEGWLARRSQPCRQDDVGRRMQYLFASVREEVQRQIQRHMAAITTASSTQELQALTAESLKRMEQSGANVSGQLLRLGVSGSGSGSGVVPSYGGGRSGGYPASVGSQSLTPGQQQQGSSSALPIVVAVGFFLLAALAILVVGINKPGLFTRADVAPPGSGLAPVTSTTPGPSATVAPDSSVAAADPQVPTSVPTVAPPPTPTKAAPHHGQPRQQTPTGRPATAVAPPPPPPDKEDPGFLTVNSYPWAKVTEGGRVICSATPCNKVSMSVGNHSLLFENAEQGFKQVVNVTIKSGETTTRAVAFK
jgi:eukaryotic-like serine/threonine-protein kinase